MRSPSAWRAFPTGPTCGWSASRKPAGRRCRNRIRSCRRWPSSAALGSRRWRWTTSGRARRLPKGGAGPPRRTGAGATLRADVRSRTAYPPAPPSPPCPPNTPAERCPPTGSWRARRRSPRDRAESAIICAKQGVDSRPRWCINIQRVCRGATPDVEARGRAMTVRIVRARNRLATKTARRAPSGGRT